MKIINNGSINKNRKDTVPLKVKNNKDFTFGIRSDIDPFTGVSYSSAPGQYTSQKGASSMHKIMGHSDNVMESLQRKIQLKLALLGSQEKRGSSIKSHGTKASELRSQSVLTNKTLNDMDRNLENIKIQKAFRND